MKLLECEISSDILYFAGNRVESNRSDHGSIELVSKVNERARSLILVHLVQ